MPGRLISRILLIGFAVYCVVPMLWLLFAATKTDAQIRDGHWFALGSFHNVRSAWNNLMGYENGIMLTWITNSIIYTVVSVAIAVVTSLLAGYALAILPVPARKTILMLTLITMVVPAAALVLPLFLEFNALHLVNTMLSVILPTSLFPFGVYLSFIYFSASVPPALIEAGRIDGCGEVRLFAAIAVPLARPLISLLVFFAFIGSWNNYFLPYVMVSEESKLPLPVGLGNLLAQTPALNPLNGGSLIDIHRPEAALAGLIAIVPVAVLFMIAQRFLSSGILAGAIKD
jgi:multiple sugar transport system permease protein